MKRHHSLAALLFTLVLSSTAQAELIRVGSQSGRIVRIAVTATDLIFGLGADQKFYSTTDLGKNWEIYGQVGGPIMDFDASLLGELWVTIRGENIYSFDKSLLSTTDGKSWRSTPLNSGPQVLVIAAAGEAVLAHIRPDAGYESTFRLGSDAFGKELNIELPLLNATLLPSAGFICGVVNLKFSEGQIGCWNFRDPTRRRNLDDQLEPFIKFTGKYTKAAFGIDAQLYGLGVDGRVYALRMDAQTPDESLISSPQERIVDIDTGIYGKVYLLEGPTETH